MKTINFCEAASFDIDINEIVCVNQSWTRVRHTWNYMCTPRPNDGFIYIFDGSAVYGDSRGKRVCANTGDVLYLPRGSRYSVEFIPFNSKSAVINFNLFCGGERAAFSDTIFPAARGVKELLQGKFESLCAAYLQTTDKPSVKAKLLEIISDMVKLAHSSEESGSINEAILYINNHLHTDSCISELAKMCAMSESQFRRKFNAAMGCSPKKYITLQKIKKAKQLLSSSELSVSEIYTLLGFYDNSHFSKAFKEITGQSPTDYKTGFR